MQIKTCFETRFECHFWETMQLYMKLTLANAKIYEAILLICVNILCDICSRIHFVQYCNRLWYNIRIPNQTSFTLKRIPPLCELKMSIYLHYLNSFTCNVYSRGLSIRKTMLWILLFLPKFNIFSYRFLHRGIWMTFKPWLNWNISIIYEQQSIAFNNVFSILHKVKSMCFLEACKCDSSIIHCTDEVFPWKREINWKSLLIKQHVLNFTNWIYAHIQHFSYNFCDFL